MTQLDLDDNYPPNFLPWVRENGHIYRAFVDRAKQMRRAGRKHYGAKGIAEVIRWDTNLTQRGEPELKLNNNYVSGLARLAMTENEELRGFFRTRG